MYCYRAAKSCKQRQKRTHTYQQNKTPCLLTCIPKAMNESTSGFPEIQRMRIGASEVHVRVVHRLIIMLNARVFLRFSFASCYGCGTSVEQKIEM